VDTSEEEKQLAILNKELQTEKEQEIEKSPEELVKVGKYKINDKTGELNNELSSLKSSVDSMKNAINQRDLFLVEEGFKDIQLKLIQNFSFNKMQFVWNNYAIRFLDIFVFF